MKLKQYKQVNKNKMLTKQLCSFKQIMSRRLYYFENKIFLFLFRLPKEK